VNFRIEDKSDPDSRFLTQKARIFLLQQEKPESKLNRKNKIKNINRDFKYRFKNKIFPEPFFLNICS